MAFPAKPSGLDVLGFDVAANEPCLAPASDFPFSADTMQPLEAATKAGEAAVAHKYDRSWLQDRTCFCCRCGVYTNGIGDIVLDLRALITAAQRGGAPVKAALVELIVTHSFYLLKADLGRHEPAVEMRAELLQLGVPTLLERAGNMLHYACDVEHTDVFKAVLARAERADLASGGPDIIGIWKWMKVARGENFWQVDAVIKRATELRKVELKKEKKERKEKRKLLKHAELEKAATEKAAPKVAVGEDAAESQGAAQGQIEVEAAGKKGKSKKRRRPPKSGNKGPAANKQMKKKKKEGEKKSGKARKKMKKLLKTAANKE